MARPKSQYHAHKMGSIVNLMIGIVKANPQVLDNPDFLKAQMKEAMPELRRKDVCPNCEASMTEYVYSFDAWDAILLLRMAEVVRDRARKGMAFTIANQVRVPELNVGHAIRCRTTQCAKLGLVTQLKSAGGKRVAGVWVITKRGYDALAGEPVPKMVRVWRSRIEERFDEKITIAAALRSHVEYVEKQFFKGRTPKQDYRVDAKEYNPKQWYEFGYHQGAIL